MGCRVRLRFRIAGRELRRRAACDPDRRDLVPWIGAIGRPMRCVAPRPELRRAVTGTADPCRASRRPVSGKARRSTKAMTRARKSSIALTRSLARAGRGRDRGAISRGRRQFLDLSAISHPRMIGGVLRDAAVTLGMAPGLRAREPALEECKGHSSSWNPATAETADERLRNIVARAVPWPAARSNGLSVGSKGGAVRDGQHSVAAGRGARSDGAWARQLRQTVCRIGLATPEGLEPSTWRLEVACSIQLSYGAVRGSLRRAGADHKCPAFIAAQSVATQSDSRGSASASSP